MSSELLIRNAYYVQGDHVYPASVKINIFRDDMIDLEYESEGEDGKMTLTSTANGRGHCYKGVDRVIGSSPSNNDKTETVLYLFKHNLKIVLHGTWNNKYGNGTWFMEGRIKES